MRGYPQVSFWISIALVKKYISCVIINRCKNTFDLVGTVLNHVPSVSVVPAPWERGWGIKPKMNFKKFESKESG